jgi:hypothetical protein
MALKYNYKVLEKDGSRYFFVYKRASFNEDEMDAVATDIMVRNEHGQQEPVIPASLFTLPHKTVFVNDVQRGVEYCENKYGVPLDIILKEGERAFPDLNLRKFLVKNG